MLVEDTQEVYNIESARQAMSDITASSGDWQKPRFLGIFRNNWLTLEIRNKLKELLQEAIRKHENGQNINGTIAVRETAWRKRLIWSSSY